MSQQSKPLSKRDRRYIFWSHFGWMIILLALGWLVVLGYVLVGRQDNRDAVLPWLLGLAGGATAFLLPLCAWRMRRAINLARHGVEITGSVITIRGQVAGRVRIDWQYEFGERAYKKARSYTPDTLSSAQAGDEVPVLVDPRKPHIAILREEALLEAPDNGASTTTSSTDIWHSGSLQWWSVTLVGLAIAGYSVYEYFRITNIEREGGELWLVRPLNWLYELFGVWGVAGAMALLAAILLFGGIYFALDKEKEKAPTGDV